MNFSTIPEERLAGAIELFSTFTRSVDQWNEFNMPVVDVHVTEDRQRAELTLRVREQPPVKQWTMQFGRAVNEARQALDALAWHLVLLGGTPKSPKRVYFPLATTNALWKEARAGLEPMPLEFVGRLWGAQPIEPMQGTSDLLVLHDLDRMHKHRGSIHVAANTGNIHQTFNVKARKGGLHSEVRMRKVPFPMENGRVIGNILFSKAILPTNDPRVSGSVELELLADADEVPIDSILLSRKVGRALRYYFDFIYDGALPPIIDLDV